MLSAAALTAELETHRRALRFHCYQLLGTLSDAEDFVQETYLRAFDAAAEFEARSSVKTWLFRIATYACIDEVRRRKRRRLVSTTRPNGSEAELGTELELDGWIEPFPDALLPDRRVARIEAVTLAFVAAVQWLPPRQRAILVLRDSLDWSAHDVAVLLGMTPGAVHAALLRARATLATKLGEPRASGREDLATARAFASAFARGDVTAIAKMLREDVEIHMPPYKLWLRGAPAVVDFLPRRIWAGRRLKLRLTRANGRLATVALDRGKPFAVMVFESIQRHRVATIHAFVMPHLVARFAT
jgi:RNA polymerase sigma-70 factor (ECF subfamily)